MLPQIAHYLKQHLQSFPEDDTIIFNNKLYPINKDNFSPITSHNTEITFIDGGQAEIAKAANFCLSIIRIAAVTFPTKKITKKEFYLLTTFKNNTYHSKIFGDILINEQDLTIDSRDNSIRIGKERAPINKVANMARRFAELSLAKQHNNVILDGTLEATYPNEEKYLPNCSSLAKSSSLFTVTGNSPIVLLNKLGPENCWYYSLNEQTSFVKLHSKAKHVFRFEGDKELIPSLINNSTDPLFLGYPYGLLLVDKLARVSNEERNTLRLKFILNNDNKEIVNYLQTTNAHSILDNIG